MKERWPRWIIVVLTLAAIDVLACGTVLVWKARHPQRVNDFPLP